MVTRTGPRAAGLVAALEDAGVTVSQLALTAQADPADGGAALRAAARGIDAYAWVVLTSVNAVERLVAVLGHPGALGRTRVAVVGPATADAVRAAGTEPDLIPPVHSAAGLVDAFADTTPGHGGRVLFPAADLAPSTVVDGLEAKGWTVDRVEAYRTVTLPPPDATRLAEVAGADAIVFLAASSVRAFAAGLRDAGDAAPGGVPGLVVCIGASTADAARDAGLPGVQEAATATPAGLVAVLVEHLGPRPGGGS